MGQQVKNLPVTQATQDMQVQSLDQEDSLEEDSLEEGMTTRSRIPA